MNGLQRLIDHVCAHPDNVVYILPSDWQATDALPDLTALTAQDMTVVDYSSVIETTPRDGGVLLITTQDDALFVTPDPARMTEYRKLARALRSNIEQTMRDAGRDTAAHATYISDNVIDTLERLTPRDFARIHAWWHDTTHP